MGLKRVKKIRKKKGFTLLELLVIIVLLAVIALVTTPVITKIIRQAKEKAFINSAYGVLEATEYYYAKQAMGLAYNENAIVPLTNKETEEKIDTLEEEEKIGKIERLSNNGAVEKISFPDASNKLNIKGKGPDSGTVYIKSKGSIALSIWSDDLGLCAIKNYEENEITFGDRELTKEECGEGSVVNSTGTSGETWDGWVTLTLYYPENSTDRKWRVGTSGEVREEDWKEYEGSITIPLSDVENVYIKYKVGGKTVVVPPKGTIYVDITPSNFEIPLSGGKVTARINATDGADVYYKTGSSWEKYNSLTPIEITSPGIIEAKAEKKEDVYDSDGNKLYSRKITAFDAVYIREKGTQVGSAGGPTGGTGGTGGSGGPTRDPETGKIIPSYYIAGPTITVNPTTTTNKVEVSLSTKEVARTIYIKVGNNPYEEYTDPVEVSSNTSIYAYYVRNSDGATSDTSYKRISNIYRQGYNCNMPIIEMKTDPGLNSKYASKLDLEITTDGNDLEYSNDGVVYQKYNGKIEITKNERIYARASNECGVTTEYIDITNIGSKGVVVPPTKKQKLEVEITAVTEPSISTILVSDVEITINYDSKATNKYYKIGQNGKLQTYTGPFKMTENETVYAYAVSVTGYGEATKLIDNIGDSSTNIPTGISSPIIKANPNNRNQTSNVEISITYDKNATIKQYRIGNGSLRTYNGPFKVNTNTTIYAVNVDSEGNKKDTTYQVSNISTTPVYVVNHGDYYIIKLNYPSSSKIDSREYRYGNNAWTKYKTDGILLALPNSTINNNGKIMITDENGNQVEFKGDYYKINCAPSEIMANIFMRWDTGKPATPKIELDTIEPSKEVVATIIYDNTSKVKEYKIVKPDGTMTNWQKYTGPLTIKEKNTVIYARAQNESEVYSDEGILKITNIDEEAPVIKLTADLSTKTQSLSVRISVLDDVKVDTVMYTKGIKGASYFKTGGTLISNNSIVKITENGDYTFYATDGVGNEQVYTIKVENIDTTAPNIKITDLSAKVGLETEVEIEYGDSVTKKYKIGENTSTWTTYTDTLTITSSDILSKKLGNSDGTITVCAQGTDDVGNKEEVCTKILTVDIDAPTTPVITSNANYPVLTEYGVKFDGRTTISYDTRKDIDNYYSLDGITWEKYTKELEVTSGTIYAKSVKKGTGLTIQTSKTISVPSDALGVLAYDNDKSTYYKQSNGTTRYLYVSPETWGKYISVKSKYSSGYEADDIIYTFYNSSGQSLGKKIIDILSGTITADFNYLIPTNTYKIGIYANGWRLNEYDIYDINMYTTPTIKNIPVYPILTNYGVEQGYNYVTIDYFNTSVQRKYSFDNENWYDYEDKKIKVELGKTIYAKGIDKNNKETEIISYTSALPSNAVPTIVYDNDESTFVNHTGKYGGNQTYYLNVDKSVQLKNISVITDSHKYGQVFFQFYNEAGTVLKKVETDAYLTATNKHTTTIPVPSECTKMSLTVYNYYADGNHARVYEIGIHDTPTFSVKKIYPTITANGVEKGYNNVSINYFDTSVQRKYSFDSETWYDYDDKPIKLEIGKTIYAKGIDKYNKETKIISYTSALPSDAATTVVYDNNESTFVNHTGKYGGNQTYYLSVDKSAQLKNINVITDSHKYGQVFFQFYNEAGTVLKKVETDAYLTATNKHTTTIPVPSECTKMSLTVYNYYADGNHARVYEIKSAS